MTVQRTFVCLFVLLILALPVKAAELSFKMPRAAANAPFLLPVLFTASPGEDLNAVEGTIMIPEGVVVDSIDTSGSSFSVFAAGPTYSETSHSITFLAGAPGGIDENARAVLFVIHGSAAIPGTYAFTPRSVAAYMNDGMGTKVAVSITAGSVVVGERGSVQIEEADSVPPTTTPLVAEVGRDESLYGGKWFVTFYGGASGSSVDYYEVKEGWWRSPVRSDRVVVLNDQSLSSLIRVTAVSENGNTIVTTIPAANPWKQWAIITVGALLVLALSIGFVRFIRRKR